MNNSKPLSKRKLYLQYAVISLFSLLIGAATYWAYAPHPFRCLYCNQPCAKGSDMTAYFGHENYVHYDCLVDMTQLLRHSGTSMFDFMITKGEHDKPLNGN